VNDGRNVCTNGPFVRVTVTGDGGATASHALTDDMLVPATFGSATVAVDIQSPTWAEFDLVEIYVNNVPSCVLTGPNFVGGSKQVCTPSTAPGQRYTPTLTKVNEPGVDGGTRIHGTASQPLTITQDSWVVVVVRGRDNISKPLFPMNPQSLLPKACSGNPCRACGTGLPACGVFGSCTVTNQTFAELTDGNMNECGELTMAIANPLFIDFDGGGYKGIPSIP